jgi:hypothetical protein
MNPYVATDQDRWDQAVHDEKLHQFRMILRRRYNQLCAQGRQAEISTHEGFLQTHKDVRREATSDKDSWWLVTFNPPPVRQSVMVLQNFLQKLTSLKLFSNWEYVIEQRSTDPKRLYGLHAHILAFAPSDNKANIIKRVHST